MRRRSWALASAGLMTLVVMLGVLALMSERAEDLLASGARVPGEVTGEWRLRHNTGFVVEYAYAGEWFEERVSARHPEPAQRAGDRVTVVLDPDDPARIRTTEHANTVRWWTPVVISLGLMGGALFVLVLLTPVLRRWRRPSTCLERPPHPSLPDVSARVARRVHRDLGSGAPRVLREMDRLARGPAMLNVIPERLHAAVALASGGSVGGYADALRLARTDWRDLFVAAGLAGADWPSVLDRELGPVDA